jgi:hypothetical protein
MWRERFHSAIVNFSRRLCEYLAKDGVNAEDIVNVVSRHAIALQNISK